MSSKDEKSTTNQQIPKNKKKIEGIQLTLNDLAKIALGAPELTHVNVAALHSLLEMLLKKLNCQNERVTLNDCACVELNGILDQSQISPLAFNDESNVNINEKLERIDKLDERIEKIHTELQTHLERTSDCQKKIDKMRIDPTITVQDWSTYGCEEICTLCKDDFGHMMACHFLQHDDLLRNLLRRVSQPMVDRVLYFEEKAKAFKMAFGAFIDKVEEVSKKLNLIHSCIDEMEQLRLKINENHAQFLSTMEEVQDMMDSKVDKLHMPALKQYFQERFRRLERNFRAFEEKKRCHRVAGFINTGLRCITCADTKVGANIDNEAIPLLPEANPRFKTKLQKKKNCVCLEHFMSTGGNRESSSLPTPESLNFNETIIFKKQPIKKNDLCPSNTAKLQFMMGSNGQYFRKG